MTSRVLLDASNLRVGGGIQVASSLIQWILDFRETSGSNFAWLRDIRIECSAEVSRNLGHLAKHDNVAQVGGSQGSPRGFDVHWKVFGPHWGPSRGRILVMGYADVTAIYPNWAIGPRARVRAVLSRKNAQRADVLVAETYAFARAVRDAGIRSPLLEVIPNSYHQVFDHPDQWQAAPEALRTDRPAVLLGYVSRAYRHKNHNLLPRIRAEGVRRGSFDVRFAVTLTEPEWMAQSDEFREACVNVGVLRTAQLPGFYSAVDGVVFPSLLEAFSATPLEALKMGVPLYASDRDLRARCLRQRPVLCRSNTPRRVGRCYRRFDDRQMFT